MKCTPAPPGITVQLYLKEEQKTITLALEEYVKGVVAAEMPALFELEALKAQAVAARTIAVRRMRRFGGTGYPAVPGADLSDDVSDSQAWLNRKQLVAKWGRWGYHRYWRKISAAVEATSGLILTYYGRPIDALYHSTSGPRTANAEELWGTAVPYLQSVPCSFDQHSPRYRQEKVFPVPELLAALGMAEKVPSGGLTLRILSRTSSGRVHTVQIGNAVFSGNELRSRLGLASTNFTVEIRAGRVVVTTIGYGHGVGLCQYGADGMARAGKTFREILHHYYPGVELKKLRLD